MPGLEPDRDVLVQVQTPSASIVIETTDQPQLFNEGGTKRSASGNSVQKPIPNQTFELEIVVRKPLFNMKGFSNSKLFRMTVKKQQKLQSLFPKKEEL